MDILYVSRKEGGKGLMSCESKIRSDEHNFGWYLKNSSEDLLRDSEVQKVSQFMDSLLEIFLMAVRKKSPGSR